MCDEATGPRGSHLQRHEVLRLVLAVQQEGGDGLGVHLLALRGSRGVCVRGVKGRGWASSSFPVIMQMTIPMRP